MTTELEPFPNEEVEDDLDFTRWKNAQQGKGTHELVEFETVLKIAIDQRPHAWLDDDFGDIDPSDFAAWKQSRDAPVATHELDRFERAVRETVATSAAPSRANNAALAARVRQRSVIMWVLILVALAAATYGLVLHARGHG